MVAPRPPGSLASSQTRGAGGSKGGSLRSPDNRGVLRGLGSIVAWGSWAAAPRLPGSLASSGERAGVPTKCPPSRPHYVFTQNFQLYTNSRHHYLSTCHAICHVCVMWRASSETGTAPEPRSSFPPKYRSPTHTYSTKNILLNRPKLYSHQSIPNSLCGGRESAPSFFNKCREDPLQSVKSLIPMPFLTKNVIRKIPSWTLLGIKSFCTNTNTLLSSREIK